MEIINTPDPQENPLANENLVSQLENKTRRALPVSLAELLIMTDIFASPGSSKKSRMTRRTKSSVEREYERESRSDLALYKAAELERLRNKRTQRKQAHKQEHSFRAVEGADSDSDIENTKRKEEKRLQKARTQEGKVRSRRRKRNRESLAIAPPNGLKYAELPLPEEFNNVGQLREKGLLRESPLDAHRSGTKRSATLDLADIAEVELEDIDEEEDEEDDDDDVDDLPADFDDPVFSDVKIPLSEKKTRSKSKTSGDSIIRSKKKPKKSTDSAHMAQIQDKKKPLPEQSLYYPKPNPAFTHMISKARHGDRGSTDENVISMTVSGIPTLVSKPKRLQMPTLGNEAVMDFVERLHESQSHDVVGLAQSFIQSYVRMLPEKPIVRDLTHKAVELPPRTRAYEESMLRAPREGERRCANGGYCEGMTIPGVQHPVINVECPPPEEFHNPDLLPDKPYLCVMCQRMNIQRAVFAVKAETETIKYPIDLACYQNIVEQPGEYIAEECMVPSSSIFQGLRGPVVMHQKYKYRQVKQDGIWWWKQLYLTKIEVKDGKSHFG